MTGLTRRDVARTSFTHDTWAQFHAFRWAVSHYGEEHAHLFVAWLCAHPAADQAYMADQGYPSVRARFEQAHPEVLTRARD